MDMWKILALSCVVAASARGSDSSTAKPFSSETPKESGPTQKLEEMEKNGARPLANDNDISNVVNMAQITEQTEDSFESVPTLSGIKTEGEYTKERGGSDPLYNGKHRADFSPSPPKPRAGSAPTKPFTPKRGQDVARPRIDAAGSIAPEAGGLSEVRPEDEWLLSIPKEVQEACAFVDAWGARERSLNDCTAEQLPFIFSAAALAGCQKLSEEVDLRLLQAGILEGDAYHEALCRINKKGREYTEYSSEAGIKDLVLVGIFSKHFCSVDEKCQAQLAEVQLVARRLLERAATASQRRALLSQIAVLLGCNEG